eukprot:gb/GECH01008089.1/.p1 GENE.gb/GECH01008089.1/~~gb/GECH01008089.1/.p1  ORF type:complete len:397 (+),score=79.42 gb/GECH01008089.1/:1-1191(+)
MYRNSENNNLLYPDLSINTEATAPQATEYGTSRTSSSRSRSDSNIERELLLSARKSGSYDIKPSFKKKRSGKICCICCAVCCCILFIPCVIIGILVGVAKIECNKAEPTVAFDDTFVFHTFDSVNVNNVIGNLDLVPSHNASQTNNTMRVVVSRKSPNFKLTKGTDASVKLDGTTLDINVKFSVLYFVGCPSTHVKLELPPGTTSLSLNKFKTDLNIGDINVEGIENARTNLKTQDGSITMTRGKNLTNSSFHTIGGHTNITSSSFASGSSSSIKTVDGDIMLYNISSFNNGSDPFILDMESKKGAINATQFQSGSIKANTVIGDISISANDNFAGTVDAEAKTGSTDVKGAHVKRSKNSKHTTKATVNGGGKQSINASTTKGDIHVSFPVESDNL